MFTCFQILHCVGVANPDSFNKCASILGRIRNKHGYAEQLNLTAREVPFMWHLVPGASNLDIKKRVQTYLNGRKADFFFEDRIIFMPMCNDTDREKERSGEGKATQRFVCTVPLMRPHLRHNSGNGHWCIWAPASEKHVLEREFQELLSHCRWLKYPSVTLRVPYFQRPSLWHWGS